MRYWVFQKTDSKKELLLVSETKNGISVFSNNDGITRRFNTNWDYIDNLKYRNELIYITTFQTLEHIPTESFFNIDIYKE